jgi:hypothetical protein
MVTFQDDPHWRDLLLFHEYFHGDNGAGIGASHQAGWTGAVARLIQLFGSTGPAEMLHGPPLPLARAYQPPGVSPAAATPGPTGDGAGRPGPPPPDGRRRDAVSGGRRRVARSADRRRMTVMGGPRLAMIDAR